jgi:hypothetical protein
MSVGSVTEDESCSLLFCRSRVLVMSHLIDGPRGDPEPGISDMDKEYTNPQSPVDDVYDVYTGPSKYQIHSHQLLDSWGFTPPAPNEPWDIVSPDARGAHRGVPTPSSHGG